VRLVRGAMASSPPKTTTVVQRERRASTFRPADVIQVPPPPQQPAPSPPHNQPQVHIQSESPADEIGQQGLRSRRSASRQISVPPEGGDTPHLDTPTPLGSESDWFHGDAGGQGGGQAAIPVVIPPPTLRPQHVYAPVAPLGMLTLGVFSKKKEDSAGDLKRLTVGGNGWRAASRLRRGRALTELMLITAGKSVASVVLTDDLLLLAADPEGPGICATILTLVSLVLVLVTLPLSLCVTVKVRGGEGREGLGDNASRTKERKVE